MFKFTILINLMIIKCFCTDQWDPEDDWGAKLNHYTEYSNSHHSRQQNSLKQAETSTYKINKPLTLAEAVAPLLQYSWQGLERIFESEKAHRARAMSDGHISTPNVNTVQQEFRPQRTNALQKSPQQGLLRKPQQHAARQQTVQREIPMHQILPQQASPRKQRQYPIQPENSVQKIYPRNKYIDPAVHPEKKEELINDTKIENNEPKINATKLKVDNGIPQEIKIKDENKQINTETILAFQYAEELINKINDKESSNYKNARDMLDFQKKVHTRMIQIEQYFREDQMPAGKINLLSNRQKNEHTRTYPLWNETKYYLSIEYTKLHTQLRIYTIGIHCDSKKTTKEVLSNMNKEYHGASDRYKWKRNEVTGENEYVEDKERSIYDYGLPEAFLLNDDQRCLLGMKYLELTGLEPIKIDLLEQGGPA